MHLISDDPAARAVVKARLFLALRRGVARLIDQAITGIATFVVAFTLWAVGVPLALLLISPGSTRDLAGLFEGGVAAFAIAGLLCVATVALIIGFPLAYFRWAARRTGDEQGQTIGKATMGFRVERADEQPVSGGRLFLRDLMLGFALFPVLVAQAAADVVTPAGRSGGYAVLVLVGGWLVLNAGQERLPHDHLASTKLVDLRVDEVTDPTDRVGSVAERA